MGKHLIQNAWYCATWSWEVDEGIFERIIAKHPIIFYRKKDGKAVAMHNMCPHRFVPLSRGTVDGDVIECAYHGLRFDSTGQCVYNPHGDGKIPKKAVARTYPLVERHDMLWVWLGDPALANPNTIPDFSCQNDPRYRCVGGVIEMHGNYEILTDNLMDLTHVEYLHRGLLGSDAISRGESEVLQDGTTVWSNRWCPNGLAPPAWDTMFDNYGKPVDHWLYMRWDAPAHMLLDVGISPTGTPRSNGIWMYGTDILTPKDETSTHYFWGVSRAYKLDDKSMDEAWRAAIDTAFSGQDKPTIEAQQTMMALHGASDIDELDPVLLTTDAGPMRCRRLLQKLRETDGVELPDPRNPALTALVEMTSKNYDGRILRVV